MTPQIWRTTQAGNIGGRRSQWVALALAVLAPVLLLASAALSDVVGREGSGLSPGAVLDLGDAANAAVAVAVILVPVSLYLASPYRTKVQVMAAAVALADILAFCSGWMHQAADGLISLFR